jgi:DNA-binding transcriptional LysR family regulator
MELRHLRYFVAVAEELHVTRAAARLGIAQPPLTQQIKALEQELGVLLFDRSGRGVTLTSAGLSFLDDARRILAQVAQAGVRARDAAVGRLGRLRVGFTESASFHPLVTRAFRAFQAAYPEVELSLIEQPSTELVAALAAEALDCAFVRPPFPSKRQVAFETVAEEAMVAALPVDHPLADRQALHLADLREEHFILYPRRVRPGLADAVIEACRRSGFEPNIGQEAPQLSSTINLVAAGMGVSIVPESMSQARAQAVRYLPVSDLDVKASLGLACRAMPEEAILLNFLALIRSLGDRPGANALLPPGEQAARW